jgi:hypothetical protein
MLWVAPIGGLSVVAVASFILAPGLVYSPACGLSLGRPPSPRGEGIRRIMLPHSIAAPAGRGARLSHRLRDHGLPRSHRRTSSENATAPPTSRTIAAAVV